VLAGGKSIRLGRNKIAEIFGQKSLLERVIARLTPLNSEILVVTALESTIPELTQYPKVKIVKDIFPGKGSLGGAYTGLTYSRTQYNLVVAGDMPFLNPKLLEHLIDLAVQSGADVVVPRINNFQEPLHAVYSTRCLPAIQRLVSQNQLSLLALFPLVKVKYVAEDEINRLDAAHLSFFNVNTEADLKLAREIAAKKDFRDDQC
jgi:molybdenum cofactor guanylyltransferase